jgi:hypothetical protein
MILPKRPVGYKFRPVLAFFLPTQALKRIAAGIHAAFVMVARVADPSAIFALRMQNFVFAQDSSRKIVPMVRDDIRTAVLAHGAGAEVAVH